MAAPKKITVRFLLTTLVGGLLFLLPVGVLIIVIAKPLVFAQKVVTPLADQLPVESIIGMKTPVLSAIFLLFLCCFLIGLYARTQFARKTIKKAEEAVLSKIPGYNLLKGMSQDLAGLEDSEAYQVVVLTLDEVGQIALLVEEGDDGFVTVFVPDAPNPLSGSVMFVKRERITPVDMTMPTAMKCLKSFGGGSAELRRIALGDTKA